jgi:hypothetical protein
MPLLVPLGEQIVESRIELHPFVPWSALVFRPWSHCCSIDLRIIENNHVGSNPRRRTWDGSAIARLLRGDVRTIFIQDLLKMHVQAALPRRVR